MKFTAPQRTAVYFKNGSLLLSAAAGSGKTASLTSRILRLITEGEAELGEMLIVTFTKAAAAEMRGKIRNALSDTVERCRISDPVSAARAAKGLAALSSASISTIHSFLYREIRKYLPTIDLPHDTRIIDPSISRSIKADAMRDTVQDRFSRSGEDGERFSFLADVIGRVRDTESVDTELLDLSEKLTSCGLDEEDLRALSAQLTSYVMGETPFFSTHAGKEVLRCTADFAEHYARVFADIYEDFPLFPAVLEKYGDAIRAELDFLAILKRLTSSPSAELSEIRTHITSFKFMRLGSLKGDDVCEISEKYKHFREGFKKSLSSLTSDFYSDSEEEVLLAAEKTARILDCTADVLGDYFARVREAKMLRSVMDYSDLETIALKLFIDENGGATDVAREIGSKYKYIFIDEFQDTNRVQDAIFRSISENSVRFMVGDIKQSIYRFRGADPKVFSDYRNAWKVLTAEELFYDDDSIPERSAEGEERSLFMSDNFRCDRCIIDFVNMVSDYTLASGGIPYNQMDRLICSKNGGETAITPVEVVMIEKKKATKNSPPEEIKCVTGNPEAAYIAGRIASLVGKYSPDGEKIISPSDIAIIMRSPGTSGEDYERELGEYGIPCRIKTSRFITSYPSVMLCMCILNFIDNPMRDIYTAGALYSSVFGFELGDILSLRKISGELPLITAITDLASEDFAEDLSSEDLSSEEKSLAPLREKCKNAASTLHRLKTVSRGMAADKFLEFLIRDLNLYSINGIRGRGEERDALARLCDMAHSFESGGAFGGLSGFIDFVEASEGAIDGGGPSDGAVSIMSIHSSKGLEFPVVFLAECGKSRNTDDEKGTLLFDGEMGLGMALPDDGGLSRWEPVLKKAVSEKIRRESTEEEMRMLYVALTRAKNLLVATGRTFDAEKSAGNAAAEALYNDGYSVMHSDKYLDWILAAAARSGNRDFYNISVVYARDIESGSAITVSDEASRTVGCPDSEEFLGRFSFEYKREYLGKIPSKLTVSRLYPEILDEDGMAEEFHEKSAERTSGRRPAFMTGYTGSGAEKGSATHLFMQFASFEKLRLSGSRTELRRLVEEGFISEDSARLVEIRQIERFAESSLLDKMLRSPLIKREFRFNVQMPASDFTGDREYSAKLREENIMITVQGVVDCVFRDPDTGSLVLVDYKTDHLSPEEWKDQKLAESKLRHRHANQLTYYKKICSRLFGEEISAALIYSTVLGRCIPV